MRCSKEVYQQYQCARAGVFPGIPVHAGIPVYRFAGLPVCPVYRFFLVLPLQAGKSGHRLLLLLLLFLTFSVLVANPKKLLYTVANPARGLLNREKRTKEKVWQHTPPPTPHTARSEKINKITRRIYRRYAGGRSRVRTRIPSARRLGLWVWLRNSTLPSAIIRFPVSLLLSSPGDV